MSFIDWKDLFDDIFEAYPDRWTLNWVQRVNTKQYQKLQNQRRMERSGRARFHCTKCSNNWTSGKAMMLLYYPSSKQPLGKVTLKFFGQQCKKCSRTDFVDPEFDDEWIKRALEKLHEQIEWFCYGKKRPLKNTNNDQKEYKSTGPHEKKLCEACQLGLCNQIKT